MFWKVVGLCDVRARLLADRHYSRQSPGRTLFTPPGNNIVLLGLDDNALWVSHRPDPRAGKEVAHRRDGFDYWDNPYFRNESDNKASDMIREALAITLWVWGFDDLAPDGFHTFVDPTKVKGTKRRGETVHGWVFQQAGFTPYELRTKERNLIRLIMSPDQLRQIEPIEPLREQSRLFA